MAAVRAAGIVQAPPIAKASGEVDQHHPLVRALGAERAAELLDGSANRRVKALDRRRIVEEMSRAGRLVREIAAATGLSDRHVVFLRGELGVGRRR